MSEVRDISVDYRDKSIDKNLRWDDTPLHETNNVDVGKSLAKFADVLQDLKKEVDRKELFTLLETVRWVYEKHNLPLNKVSQIVKQYRTTLERQRIKHKLVAHKKKINAKVNTEVYAISLSDWEYNRNMLIQSCEEHYKKPMLRAVVKERYRHYTSIGGWFYCFDYFFNHIKEYKADKKFFEIEWGNNIKILNTMPNKNETLYILHRITKNAICWAEVIKWLNDDVSNYKKAVRKQFRQQTIIKSKITADVKYLCKTLFGVKIYNMKGLYLYSERQIKALIWLRDNFNKKYPYLYLTKKKQTNISVFFDNLRDFLKNKQHYIEKYNCVWESNKVYRSLWL